MHKQTIITLLALASGCLLVQAQTRSAVETTPSAKEESRTTFTTSSELLDQDQGQLSALVRAQEDQANSADIAVRTLAGWKGESATARNQSVMVTTTQTNAETLATLDEDLSVMSLLLDKGIATGGRPNPDRMLGINIDMLQSARMPQNLYIEGQGALFVRHVKLALLPGNAKDKEKNTSKKDSAWDEAKRDLYGPRNSRIKYSVGNRGMAAPYDAEKVEHLTREIVGILKNAANIRGLAANESVTVVLLGAPESFVGDVIVREGEKREMTVSHVAAVRARDEHSTTMTIRIKKADAEAALSGSIDLAELQKRAAVSVY